jgi:hypothetical protein
VGEDGRVAPHLAGLAECAAIGQQLVLLEAPLRGERAERLGLGGEVALQRADGIEVAIGERLGRRTGLALTSLAAGSRSPLTSRSTPILKKRSAGIGRITSTSASSPSSSTVRSSPSWERGETVSVNHTFSSCSRR